MGLTNNPASQVPSDPNVVEVRRHVATEKEIEFKSQFIDPTAQGGKMELLAQVSENGGNGTLPNLEKQTETPGSGSAKTAVKSEVDFKIEKLQGVSGYLREISNALDKIDLRQDLSERLAEAKTQQALADNALDKVVAAREAGQELSQSDSRNIVYAKENLNAAFETFRQVDQEVNGKLAFMRGDEFEKHAAVLAPDAEQSKDTATAPAVEKKDLSTLLEAAELAILNKDLAKQCKSATDACAFIRERAKGISFDGKVELLNSLADPQSKVEALTPLVNDAKHVTSDQEIRDLNQASSDIAAALEKLKKKDPAINVQSGQETDRALSGKYTGLESALKEKHGELAFSSAADRYKADYEKLAGPLNAISNLLDRDFFVRVTKEGPLWQRMVTMQEGFLNGSAPTKEEAAKIINPIFTASSEILSTKYPNVCNPVEQLKDADKVADLKKDGKKAVEQPMPILSYAEQAKLVQTTNDNMNTAVELSRKVSAVDGGRSWSKRNPAVTEVEGILLTTGIFDARQEGALISSARKLADASPGHGVSVAEFEAVRKFQLDRKDKRGIDNSQDVGLDKTSELGLVKAVLTLADNAWKEALVAKGNADLASKASTSLAPKTGTEAQASK